MSDRGASLVPTLSLPLEIINQVVLHACIDGPVVPLLSVCKTFQSWLLPVLYHSITLTKSSRLSKFLSSHDIPDDPMESRFSLIRNIYIGSAPQDRGDLLHGSTNWPVTIVSRILWLSTSLKRLTLVNLDQNKWHLLEHAIPASLEFLSMGPVHGPFRPQDMTRMPKLQWFTSAVTYMRDDEVRDTACYPSMRVFRRLFHPVGITPQFAVDQVGCIDKAKTLEIMEIVVSGTSEEACREMVQKLRQRAVEITSDSRVVVSMDLRAFSVRYWDEWAECRLAFIISQIV